MRTLMLSVGPPFANSSSSCGRDCEFEERSTAVLSPGRSMNRWELSEHSTNWRCRPRADRGVLSAWRAALPSQSIAVKRIRAGSFVRLRRVRTGCRCPLDRLGAAGRLKPEFQLKVACCHDRETSALGIGVHRKQRADECPEHCSCTSALRGSAMAWTSNWCPCSIDDRRDSKMTQLVLGAVELAHHRPRNTGLGGDIADRYRRVAALRTQLLGRQQDVQRTVGCPRCACTRRAGRRLDGRAVTAGSPRACGGGPAREVEGLRGGMSDLYVLPT